MPEIAPWLSPWESYYVIVGSSAAALTGLQFVVIALVSDMRRASDERQIAAFGTPGVVHFSVALLLSALLSAPWRGLGSPALLLGAVGLVGVGYTGIVLRRARQQEGYEPVFEDWLWHTILPAVAYAAIAVAGVTLRAHAEDALFLVAAATLLLVFIGIHNAWDTVTFIATTAHRDAGGAGPAEETTACAPAPAEVAPATPSGPPPA